MGSWDYLREIFVRCLNCWNQWLFSYSKSVAKIALGHVNKLSQWNVKGHLSLRSEGMKLVTQETWLAWGYDFRNCDLLFQSCFSTLSNTSLKGDIKRADSFARMPKMNRTSVVSYLFPQQIVSAYCILGTIVDTWDTWGSKESKTPAFMGLSFQSKEMDSKY